MSRLSDRRAVYEFEVVGSREVLGDRILAALKWFIGFVIDLIPRHKCVVKSCE